MNNQQPWQKTRGPWCATALNSTMLRPLIKASDLTAGKPCTVESPQLLHSHVLPSGECIGNSRAANPGAVLILVEEVQPGLWTVTHDGAAWFIAASLLVAL